MISCAQHNCVEIACMHRLLVRLEHNSGKIVEGSAVDIVYNANKQECLKILTGKRKQLILLSDLLSMQS